MKNIKPENATALDAATAAVIVGHTAPVDVYCSHSRTERGSSYRLGRCITILRDMGYKITGLKVRPIDGSLNPVGSEIQRIKTTYVGPTDFTGSRVRARATLPGKKTFSYTTHWKYELNPVENHYLAAESLAKQHGIPSSEFADWRLEDTPKGYAFVRPNETKETT